MKKNPGSKVTALLLGGLSLLVLIFLITSLSNLVFKPGVPFAYQQSPGESTASTPPTWSGFNYFIIIFVLVLIGIFILLSPEQRKRYLMVLGLLALAGFLVFLFISRLSLGTPVNQEKETPGKPVITIVPGPSATPEPELPPAIFTPPQVSSLGAFLTTLVILLLVAGGIGWLMLVRRKEKAPYEALANIARSALEDIETGKDLGDAILNSYQRMTIAVAEWRGIHRQASMTPAEFASYLSTTHLPPAAVSNLTKLFEKVRYGEKESTSEDIREAVDCLSTILDYCQVNQ